MHVWIMVITTFLLDGLEKASLAHYGAPHFPRSERYLLYDVKPGEGFNLQREVFPRVGWIATWL